MTHEHPDPHRLRGYPAAKGLVLVKRGHAKVGLYCLPQDGTPLVVWGEEVILDPLVDEHGRLIHDDA